MSEMINANFDRRRKIYKISDENLLMVDTARSVGASAKFTGSGGAVVGIFKDEAMFGKLKRVLSKHKIKVVKPRIAMPGSNERMVL
jgi:glucuronokinase